MRNVFEVFPKGTRGIAILSDFSGPERRPERTLAARPGGLRGSMKGVQLLTRKPAGQRNVVHTTAEVR